ncbi:cytochrome P450 [Streptomyces sp. NPDC026672]|uniref:cytochrome P450 n=1 Tax=unclassified Streptomyces TaxID=2593676 RepID=UPI0033C64630
MTEAIPDYSYAHSTTCPFDPGPQLTAAAPVDRVRIWDGSTPWLVTGYAEARQALSDPRLSSDDTLPGYPHQTAASRGGVRRTPTLTTLDNPGHDARRRLLTRSFMVRRMEALRPGIQLIVDGLINDMVSRGGTADLVRDFALPVPSLVICELLGVPYEDHEFFQDRSRLLVSVTTDAAERASALADLSGYLDALVRRKAQAPADDLLSRLITDHVPSGTLTLDEVSDMGRFLLFAGHETTANMIALGTLALLHNPAQLAAVRDSGDPDLVADAVEELLRYLTIVHVGRRRVAVEDLELGGRRIAAGEGVIIALNAANRDAGAFEGDPDGLDVTRPARHHVAFGYGIHQCLGQPLARVELQVVYGTLYRRLPGLRLAVPFEEVAFKDDMFVYGVHSLPVTW